MPFFTRNDGLSAGEIVEAFRLPTKGKKHTDALVFFLKETPRIYVSEADRSGDWIVRSGGYDFRYPVGYWIEPNECFHRKFTPWRE